MHLSYISVLLSVQHSSTVTLSKARAPILLVKEQEIQQDETTHLLKRRKLNDLEKCRQWMECRILSSSTGCLGQ
jgi:hypothetical protein